MPLLHDTPVSIQDIFNEVSTDIYDTGLIWFNESDILAAIQEAYNKVVGILQPIESSIIINQLSSPYYDLSSIIPNYMYLVGIFNPQTNLWLDGVSYKIMKATWQTYMSIGQPRCFNVIDFRRALIWPFLNSATGVLYVVYKAAAPTISYDHVPLIPYSVCGPLLEYFAVADLLEQAREFKKAQLWWNKVFTASPGQRSLMDQAALEIKDLARTDHETVLEPYRWIFHGGFYNATALVTNEIPSGIIDGSNNLFQLAKIPNPQNSLVLTVNGVTYSIGTQYSINGQSISFNTTYIPPPGATVLATYQVS